MIPRLASPSVCVIDEDEKDYRPILDALLRLGLGCVHVRGDTMDTLPPEPFNGLRVVFTDLHLSASGGKSGASHTASVFKKVVSPKTAPVLVVIWSKYANDRANDASLPPDDQPTDAELFKQTLLEAEPKFKGRLIFVEMPKPKVQDRPEASEWIKTLQKDIGAAFSKYEAFDVLWSWESIARNAELSISEELTTIALPQEQAGASMETRSQALNDNLKLVFRLLAKEQGGPDCLEAPAPRHLTTVLAQSLADRLEHSENLETLSRHGAWLSDKVGLPKESPFAAKLNSLLLTAATQEGGGPFIPGTVYNLTKTEMFTEIFGTSPGEIPHNCYTEVEKNSVWSLDEWKKQVKHVFVELSPACDFHQSHRRQSLLVGGLIVPSVGRIHAKRGDAVEILPTFSLRWSLEGFPQQDVFLILSCRHKLTLPTKKEPDWLKAWFRLRELPTAAIRNWHSSHASRVGYVSFR